MKRTAIRFLLLMSLACLALLAAACSPSTPSTETFDREIQVVDSPGAQDEMAPGLYCLVSTGGGSRFDLAVGQGSRETLIRAMEFSSRAWVELRPGETLKVKEALIESYDEREMKGCYPTRLSNGFFLIGMDLFPGRLTVNRLDSEGDQGWICEVYDNAHDLSEGPVRRYDFDYSMINIDVEEGEFLYLRNTEAYIPPS